MSGEFDKTIYSLCVECGPNVRIDEDGCCAFCGNGAVGTWLDGHQGLDTPAVASRMTELLSQLSSTREKYEQAVRERDSALRELERWRHGVPIEGDYVCPDSLALTDALRERDELRAENQRLMEVVANDMRDIEALKTAGCSCRELGPATLRSGDICRFCERVEASHHHPERQMSRLTDEELNEAMEVANSLYSMRLVAAVGELRARRAADLSGEQLRTIDSLKAIILSAPWDRAFIGRAVEVLNRLLGGRDA